MLEANLDFWPRVPTLTFILSPQSGFFGLHSQMGCQVCGCNQSGSLSESCDEKGRCQCMTGVGGDKCDRCGHGYYGVHVNSCRGS